jgi:hypothetical protein
MIEIIQLDRDKDEHKRTKNIGTIRKQTTTENKLEIKKGGMKKRDKRPFSNIASYLICTRQTMITVHIETTIKGEETIHNGEKIRDHDKLKNEQNASSNYQNMSTQQLTIGW